MTKLLMVGLSNLVAAMAPAAPILVEPFDYGNGPLTAVAATNWNWTAYVFDGTNTLDVLNGQAILSQARRESVYVDFPGGPFETNTLYFSFKLKALSLPGVVGSFVGFKDDATNLRASIFVATNGIGGYRVGIANGDTFQGAIPNDLAVGAEYFLVVRYNPGSATSTLWIDPQSETATTRRMDALDVVAPLPATALALRQVFGIGTLAVDDLKVGFAFSDVAVAPPVPILLAMTDVSVGSGATVNLSGPPGHQVTIEFSSQLNGWNVLSFLALDGLGHAQVIDPGATGQTQRYYRAVDVTAGGNVYSVNVVGVINLALPTGYSLLTYPFFRNSNSVEQLFPQMPNGSGLFKPQNNVLAANNFLNGWTTPGMSLRPGEGFFVYQPGTPLAVHFWGELPQGNLVNNLPPGVSYAGSIVPQAGLLSTDLGFVPSPGDSISRWNGSAWSVHSSFEGIWDPQEPALQTAEGFILSSADGNQWQRNFSVSGGTPYAISPSTAVNSPGKVNFFTFNVGDANKGRIYEPGGATPASTNYLAQLYAGASAVESNLVPVGLPARLASGTLAGYVNSKTVEIPGTAPSGTVYLQVRVWDDGGGARPTFESAVTGSTTRGKSEIVPLLAGGNGIDGPLPPIINTFQSFNLQAPTPLAPSIVTQPISQAVAVGATATFQVVASGTPPLSYQWQKDGVNIPGATADTLVLSNVQFSDAGDYSVAVNNASGTVVSELAILTVNPAPPIGLYREVYTGIASGGSLSALTNNANFPNNPTSTELLTNVFETPANLGDNYGQRIRGLITAPQTGNYTFWIASDDQSALYLSADKNPANKVKIASVDTWSGPRIWNASPSQQSSLIPLAAGQSYYVEALHADGGVGDHLAVRWQLPDANIEEPIPASRFTPFGSEPQILEQPADASAYQGENAYFQVGLQNPGGATYQWLKGGTTLNDGGNISGATTPILTLSEVRLADAGSYSVVASNASGMVTSQVAVLTVMPIQHIANVMASASSELTSLGRLASGLVDGQLDQDFNLVDQGSVWESSGIGFTGSVRNDRAPAVIFDLRSTYLLRQIRVWNFPEIQVAVKGIRIEMSLDGKFFSPMESPSQLNATHGTSEKTVLPIFAGIARYVRFTILDNYGGTVFPVPVGTSSTGFFDLVGLTEVQFFGDPVPTPPDITGQPQDQMVFTGGAAVFGVTVAGTPPLSYQWFFNNSPLPGANASILRLADLKVSDAGSYRVVVTNNYGMATSQVARLQVYPQCVNLGAGLAAWWEAESNSLDTTGLNHGFLSNGVQFASGKRGSAFSLDGVDDYVLVPAGPSLSFAGAMSIEAWVYPSNVFAAEPQVIAAKRNLAANQDSWSLELASGAVRFTVNADGTPGGVRRVETSPEVLPPGQWIHIVAVFDPLAQEMLIYLNGQEAPTLPSGLPTVPSLFDGPEPARLGASIGAQGQATNFFAGLLDEITLYHRPLTAKEAALLHRADSAGKCKPPVIVQQPQDLDLASGDPVDFTVQAIGLPPLRYQWRHNGVAIPGATNETYHLDFVNWPDAGTYAVVVRDAAGATLSRTAVLRIQCPALLLADFFVNRSVIDVNVDGFEGRGRGSNEDTSREPGEPLIGGRRGSNSVWITLRSPVGGIATVSLEGSTFDTVLGVYQGNAVSNLTLIAQDDDSAGFKASLVTFNLLANEDYHLAIDSLGPPGLAVLRWSVEETPNRLPTLTNTLASQIISAGSDVEFDLGASTLAQVTWYRNGELISDAKRLQIEALTEQDVGKYFAVVVEAGREISTAPIEVQFNLIDGRTDPSYAARDKFQDSFDPSLFTSPRQLVQQARRPLDRTSGPTRGYTGTQVFNTYGATAEEGEPIHCGIVGGVSEWFTYQAPTNGLLIIHTGGSDYDTILAVYSVPGNTPPNTFADLVNVACDNNSYTNNLSLVSFLAEAETIYYVAIDGVEGATGLAKLNYELIAPPAITGQPSNQVVRTGFPASLTAQTSGANLVYQWWFNAVAWADATNSLLNLASANATNAGDYFVVITNAAGAVTSSVVTLSVLGELRLAESPQFTNGEFRLVFSNLSTQSWLTIQATTTLTNWFDVLTTNPTAGTLEFSRPAESNFLFFRAIQGQ